VVEAEIAMRVVALECWDLAEQVLRLLRVDNGQSFKRGNVAQLLVGTDKLVHRSCVMYTKSYGQLNRVESPQLTSHPMLAYQCASELIVHIDDSDGTYDSPLDICQKLAAECCECVRRKHPGAYRPGESRKHLDCRKP
jgi:hypothetical protein